VLGDIDQETQGTSLKKDNSHAAAHRAKQSQGEDIAIEGISEEAGARQRARGSMLLQNSRLSLMTKKDSTSLFDTKSRLETSVAYGRKQSTKILETKTSARAPSIHSQQSV